MGAPSPEGAPRRAPKSADKRAERKRIGRARDAARDAALGPVSRAQAIAAVCREVSGEADAEGGVPVPLAMACGAHGLSYDSVRADLERGALPELARAREHGRMVATRRACGDGPDARQWAWLAERLAPKELHLPTRVTGVAAEDGGAPIATAALTVTLVEARALARDDYDGPIRALPEGTGGR